MPTPTDRRPSRLARSGALVGLACSLLVVGACGGGARPAAERAAAPDAAAAPTRLRSAEDVPFERSWDLRLPGKVHRSWISPNIPELLFVQVEGGNQIYAIDALSGRTRFVTQALPRPMHLAPYVQRTVMPSGRVNETYNDDRLYVVSDDTLYCFDAIYGEKIWGYDLPFTAASGPMGIGPDGNLRVFLGDFAGRMQVVTWNADKRGFVYPLWQYKVGGPITAQPVESESLVYAGDHAGVVNCFRLDRELVWSQSIGGVIRGSVLVARNLYVGSTDNVFHVLNRLSGESMAKLYLNAPIERQPFNFLTDPNRVYVWTTHADPRLGGLWALDVRNDMLEVQHDLDAQNRPRKKEIVRLSQAWFVPGATTLVSSTPEHLFITRGETTRVDAINRRTGAIDWSWDVGAGRKGDERIVGLTAFHDPTNTNRSLYAVEAGNRLVSWRIFGWKPGEPVAAAPAPAAPRAE